MPRIFENNIFRKFSSFLQDVEENREEETEREREREKCGKKERRRARVGCSSLPLSTSSSFPSFRPSFLPSFRPFVPFFVVNLLFRLLSRPSSLAAARGVGKHHTGSPVDFRDRLCPHISLSLSSRTEVVREFQNCARPKGRGDRGPTRDVKRPRPSCRRRSRGKSFPPAPLVS